MTQRRRRQGNVAVASPSATLLDWLSLVEPDGAFLTPTLLRSVFPHGFEPLDKQHRTELRARVRDVLADPTGAAALRQWLLREVLGWGDQLAEGSPIPARLAVNVAEHGAVLRPEAALLDLDDPNRVRLGVFIWAAGTDLHNRPSASSTGDSWTATPVQRAERWCRESGVPLAIVTDDERWVLVWAPRGAASATCGWRLGDLADEPTLQAGMVSLLSVRRFFAVPDDPVTGETLERLFERAADAEVEITKGLGRQVRRSVELLIAAISRENAGSAGRGLGSVAHEELYEAGVTVLMRIVFLLYAEERRLLPAEDPLWADAYSVLSLRDQLREAAHRDGAEALERRSSAWHRLLATFRAVHGGVRHDRLRLPAYGGALFDPDRFAFLEGRHDGGGGRPVGIDDRTVLAILDALLTVEVGTGTRRVAQRLSYRTLDVEQIGHCYEGLLDHGCAPVEELSLGLVGREGDEPEISVADLERHFADGAEALATWLSDKQRCGKSVKELTRLLARQPVGVELARLRATCGNDDASLDRVLPLWGVARLDLRGLPMVYLPGTTYVTQTSTRRSTGAQYTNRALADEVVRYALEPLIYRPGPADEPDPSRWVLRPSTEIIGLRVCDPAVGSGAILTAACRFLADRLVESVIEHGPGDGPFTTRFVDLVAALPEDQATMARREVVDHCLYGVDKNPIAAEMAKLSLWLTTMARERPFTFLDHAIGVGDSLLGITDVDQLRWLHLDPSARRGEAGFDTVALEARLKAATELAQRLQSLSVITIGDAEEKRRLNGELQATLSDLSIVADVVVGAALNTSAKGSRTTVEDRLAGELDRVHAALDEGSTEFEREAALLAIDGRATAWLRTDLPDEPPAPWDRRCFHWPLRFPEVFLADGRSGFDAMVANPPFLGGKRISGPNGVAYREHLVRWVADGATGNADLVTYFLLRMCGVARSVGSLATNTLSQGDTREVGLDRLTDTGWTIHRAVKSEPWPNEANLEIAKVWLWDGDWTGKRWLGYEEVTAITPSLDLGRRVMGRPYRLKANAGRSFQGCILATMGFVLDDTEAWASIEIDPRNADVVKPYAGGEDLNTVPSHQGTRWVVDFDDWPEERARTFDYPWEVLEKRVRPHVLGKEGYPGWAGRWWQFWNPRPALRRAVAGLDRVVALAQVSKTIQPVLVPAGQIFSHKTVVFSYSDHGHFGLLTSGFHWWWTLENTSTMRIDPSYSPTDVFQTFPQPEPQHGPLWERIDTCGRGLNEFRAAMMVRTDLGLTKTYNRVHDGDEQHPDIVRLRGLHGDLDHAVRDAYGWSDLELDHHHRETPQGVRFTVGPEAKDELLDRLLELNHARYAAEVAAGLHDKRKPPAAVRAPRRGRDAPGPHQGSLL